MTLIMYDSIQDNIPNSAQAIAGYVGGHWPTATEPWFGRHPARYKLTIAINATEQARCLDVERGDASPSEAPEWFRTKAQHKWGRPVLYCSTSVSHELIDIMSQAGIPREAYYLWSAHYGHGQHICGPTCGFPQADLTQWTDSALGRSLDESLVNAVVFSPTQPPHPNPHKARRPLKPHRKVIASTGGAGLSAAVAALLGVLKVPIDPTVVAGVAAALAAIAGYVTPSYRKVK